MSKSILIFDAPEICLNCLCCDKDNLVCIATKNLIEDVSRPDRCPLRPMLEKKWEPDETDTYEGGYADGWNDCLDTIENKNNE